MHLTRGEPTSTCVRFSVIELVCLRVCVPVFFLLYASASTSAILNEISKTIPAIRNGLVRSSCFCLLCSSVLQGLEKPWICDLRLAASSQFFAVEESKEDTA